MIMRAAASRACLDHWVDEACPRTDYFRSIQGFREIYRRHLKEAPDPNFPTLAVLVASLLDQDESLYRHIIDRGVSMSTAAEWEQLCVAAAWLILDRYDSAIYRGDWAPRL